LEFEILDLRLQSLFHLLGQFFPDKRQGLFRVPVQVYGQYFLDIMNAQLK